MNLGKIIDKTGRLTKKTLIGSMKLVGGAVSLACKTGSLATRGLSYGMGKGAELYEASQGSKQYDEIATEANRISEQSGVKINPQDLVNYMANEAFGDAYNQETARQEAIKESIANFYNPKSSNSKPTDLNKNQDGTWA